VHIAARVASLAGPGEVLVSSTVKDLVAGSGIELRSGAVTPSRGYATNGEYLPPGRDA